MRILLVEDDQKAARLVAKGLYEAGFLVDVARSGEEGDVMADAERLCGHRPGLAESRADVAARTVSTTAGTGELA